MTNQPLSPWVQRYRWSIVAVAFWLLVTLVGCLWHVYAEHWPVSITMLFGSFVAGATAEGGGAIAFPVFTKLLKIAPATARDFALAIQSIGMTCGSLLIIRSGYPFFPAIVKRVAVGSALGVCVGLTWLVQMIPPPYPKILFTLFTVSFGFFLAWENFVERRMREEEGSPHVELGWSACLLIGILGGLISSIVGSGADVVLFVVLCRRFSCHEKSATRTTIPVMALTSQIGFLFQMLSGNLSPGVLSMWWSAFPIVAFGAPLGAMFCSWQKREAVVLFLLLLILIELVTTLILVPFDRLAVLISALFVVGSLLVIRRLRVDAPQHVEKVVANQP